MSKRRAKRSGSKLARSVYERIRADIFDFRLLPGARFSENELATRSGVSRTPLACFVPSVGALAKSVKS